MINEYLPIMIYEYNSLHRGLFIDVFIRTTNVIPKLILFYK